MKTAAEMIMHSTRRHFAEGEENHLECVLARLGIARLSSVGAEKKIQRYRTREFRRASEAAFMGIVGASELLIGYAESFYIELPCSAGRTAFRLLQSRHDLPTLLDDFFVVLLPRRRDPL